MTPGQWSLIGVTLFGVAFIGCVFVGAWEAAALFGMGLFLSSLALVVEVVLTSVERQSVTSGRYTGVER